MWIAPLGQAAPYSHRQQQRRQVCSREEVGSDASTGGVVLRNTSCEREVGGVRGSSSQGATRSPRMPRAHYDFQGGGS